MAIRRTIQSAPKVASSAGSEIVPATRPTIVAVTAKNETDAAGAVHTIVDVLWKPPTNRQDFVGVHAWIEAPDFSGVPDPEGVDPDTALTLDSTPLPAPQNRQDVGRFAFHAADMDAAGQIRSRMPALPAPKAKETWRLYLEGYNASYDKLIPLPESNHSPTAAFEVDPGIYGLGIEYAPLVTDVAAIYELYWSGEQGKWVGRIKTTWKDPDPTKDPERFKQFSGVIVTFQFEADNDKRVDLPFAPAGQMQSLQDYCDVPAVQVVRVWVRSVGTNRAIANTIQEGVTPNVRVTTLAAPQKGDVSGWNVTAAYNTANPDGVRQLVINTAWTAPPDDPTFGAIDVWVYNQASQTWNIFARQDKPGAFSIEERFWPVAPQSWDFYAVSVTSAGVSKHDFSAHDPGASPKQTVALVPFTDSSLAVGDQVYANDVTNYQAWASAAATADGVDCFQFGGTFNKPANDTRYKGCRIVARPVGGNGSTDFVVAECGPSDQSFLGAKTTTPSAAAQYALYFVSCDASRNYNPIMGGTPQAAVTVTPGTGGIKMPRIDPNSYDQTVFGIVNQKFQITAVPMDTPKAGTYDPNVFKKAADNKFTLNFSTQFDTSLGYLRIKAIDASTINTGTLSIGGSGITGVSVYNNLGALIGWIGTNGSVYGGWFQKLWVGGSDPSTSKLYIDPSGNLIMLGTLYGSASQFTGSISASQITTNSLLIGGSGQATGVYCYQWNGSYNSLVGWIGANGQMNGGWFKNVWVGGVTGPSWNALLGRVDPNDAKIYLDNTGAAWFKGNITASNITGSTLTLTSGANVAAVNSSEISFTNSYSKASLTGSRIAITPGTGSEGVLLYAIDSQAQIAMYSPTGATLFQVTTYNTRSAVSMALAATTGGQITLDPASSYASISATGNIRAAAFYENGTALAQRYSALGHTHTDYALVNHTHTGASGDFSVGGRLTIASGITVGASPGLGNGAGYGVQIKDHSGNDRTLWFLGGIAYALT